MSIVPGKKPAASVDNTARRVWDKDAARKRAAEKDKKEEENGELTALELKKQKRLERDPLHQGLIVQRSHLKQRDFQIDLASRLGKTQVVGLNTPLAQQAGYYCQVCDCILRDSASYLDHINGKWHNRALGMTMRVEKSTVDQIRQKLAAKKEEVSKQGEEDFLPDGVDRRILEQQEAEEREKEERRRERKEAKRREKEERDKEEEALLAQAADPDMMAMMGFGGFGGSKK